MPLSEIKQYHKATIMKDWSLTTEKISTEERPYMPDLQRI